MIAGRTGPGPGVGPRSRGTAPHRLALSALLAALLLASTPGRGDAPSPQPAAGDPGAATSSPPVLDEVWRLTRRHFFDPDLPRAVDWDAARERHRPAATAAATAEERSAAIDRMLAELGSSHTAHYTPADVAYYHLLDIFAGSRELRGAVAELFPGTAGVRYTGLGAFFEQIDGRTFVAGVWPGSNADRAGLVVGDEILAADDEPFEPIESFRGKAGETVRLRVRRAAHGAPETVAVVPEEIRPKEALLDAMRESARIVERAGRRIGYIRIWSYAGREYQDLLVRELSSGRLKGADALLIDLRGGWGGASPEYLDPFTPGPAMTVIDRGGEERAVAFKWRRPVGLLVDEGTRSGKEILAHGFRRYGLGPVVGETTAGAVLAGRVFLLPDDSLLYLAVADVLVDGERLEGVGVAPDVPVPFDVEHAEGDDPQLDRALDELARIGG